MRSDVAHQPRSGHDHRLVLRPQRNELFDTLNLAIRVEEYSLCYEISRQRRTMQPDVKIRFMAALALPLLSISRSVVRIDLGTPHSELLSRLVQGTACAIFRIEPIEAFLQAALDCIGLMARQVIAIHPVSIDGLRWQQRGDGTRDPGVVGLPAGSDRPGSMYGPWACDSAETAAPSAKMTRTRTIV